MIFATISLKWIKSLTKFYCPEANLRKNGAWKCQSLLIMLVDPLLKHRVRTKFTETGNLKHLYRNELDKTCFVHDATYSNSKDLENYFR